MANLKISQLPAAATATTADIIAIVNGGVTSKTTLLDVANLTAFGVSGNTSGTCISDIYVSTVHSCSELKINPNDEGDISFGATSGVTIDLINNRLNVNSTLGRQYNKANYGINILNNGAKIAFGDNNDLSVEEQLPAGGGINCFIGEWAGIVYSAYTDSDVMHMHGKKGHRITIGNVAQTSAIHVRNAGSSANPLVNVGINNDSPTEVLDVSGNTIISGTLNIGTIGSGTLSSDIGVTAAGLVITHASDRRLKENIETISNSMDIINQLRGVTYIWKDDEENNTRIGFIAQEVEEIIPELMFENEVDGMKGVHYKDFTALLLEGIKEQQIIIEKQQNQINELVNRVGDLEDNFDTK